MFILCFVTGHIPTSLNTIRIIPVPKKSVIFSTNDLRPVALTSVVMKAYEQIVLNKMSILLKEMKKQLY